MHPRRYLIAALLLAAIGGVLYGARSSVLPWAARWLNVGQRPAKVDYVYVLGGDVNFRPLVAAAIYRAGLAKKVLVSHVDFEPGEDAGILKPQHARISAMLRVRGVPAEDIILVGNRNRTTHDEAVALAAWLPEASASRVIVVTSAFHTRRARWIFGQVFRQRAGVISLVSAPVEDFAATDWWKSAEGFRAIVGENIKFFASLILYRPVACVLGGIAAAMCLVVLGVLRRHRKIRRAGKGTAQSPQNR